MQKKDINAYSTRCIQEAKKYNVIPDIHPLDYVFQFLAENSSVKSAEDAVKYYFYNSAVSAKKLAHLISDVCHIRDWPFDLFEFACGYGCVTRHLSKVIDSAQLTSCDTHESAVRFLQQKVGVKSIPPTAVPWTLKFIAP